VEATAVENKVSFWSDEMFQNLIIVMVVQH
jgi:hypothetical protein